MRSNSSAKTRRLRVQPRRSMSDVQTGYRGAAPRVPTNGHRGRSTTRAILAATAVYLWVSNSEFGR